MARRLEDYLPGLKEDGINTDENITTTGTVTAAGISNSGASTITSASANALAVGANGTTNPAFKVDASTASSATGVRVKSAAAAGAVAIDVVSSGTNESLTIDAKGTGNITLGSVSTGTINVVPVLRAASTTTVTAGGAQMLGFGTATARGVYVGSGAPTVSAAQGSLYLRTDGSSTSTRAYINTDGATTWTAITTAA